VIVFTAPNPCCYTWCLVLQLLGFKSEGSNPEHGKINTKVTSAKVQELEREASE
jgi:hypothetical protein